MQCNALNTPRYACTGACWCAHLGSESRRATASTSRNARPAGGLARQPGRSERRDHPSVCRGGRSANTATACASTSRPRARASTSARSAQRTGCRVLRAHAWRAAAQRTWSSCGAMRSWQARSSRRASMHCSLNFKSADGAAGFQRNDKRGCRRRLLGIGGRRATGPAPDRDGALTPTNEETEARSATAHSKDSGSDYRGRRRTYSRDDRRACPPALGGPRAVTQTSEEATKTTRPGH